MEQAGYSVDGFPAGALLFEDGSSVHVERYAGFVSVTWSSDDSPGSFLRLVTKFLTWRPETSATLVLEAGRVLRVPYEQALWMADETRFAVARLDNTTQRLAAVWEIDPDRDGHAEVGVAAHDLPRAALEQIFAGSCSRSIADTQREAMDLVSVVAESLWSWVGPESVDGGRGVIE